jgi:hypothetical protein
MSTDTTVTSDMMTDVTDMTDIIGLTDTMMINTVKGDTTMTDTRMTDTRITDTVTTETVTDARSGTNDTTAANEMSHKNATSGNARFLDHWISPANPTVVRRTVDSRGLHSQHPHLSYLRWFLSLRQRLPLLLLLLHRRLRLRFLLYIPIPLGERHQQSHYHLCLRHSSRGALRRSCR